MPATSAAVHTQGSHALGQKLSFILYHCCIKTAGGLCRHELFTVAITGCLVPRGSSASFKGSSELSNAAGSLAQCTSGLIAVDIWLGPQPGASKSSCQMHHETPQRKTSLTARGVHEKVFTELTAQQPCYCCLSLRCFLLGLIVTQQYSPHFMSTSAQPPLLHQEGASPCSFPAGL